MALSAQCARACVRERERVSVLNVLHTQNKPFQSGSQWDCCRTLTSSWHILQFSHHSSLSLRNTFCHQCVCVCVCVCERHLLWTDKWTDNDFWYVCVNRHNITICTWYTSTHTPECNLITKACFIYISLTCLCVWVWMSECILWVSVCILFCE